MKETSVSQQPTHVHVKLWLVGVRYQIFFSSIILSLKFQMFVKKSQKLAEGVLRVEKKFLLSSHDKAHFKLYYVATESTCTIR